MAHRPGMASHGPSQRQLRVGELIRRAISDVLMRGDVHEPDLDGVSITVGEVRTTPDLRHATVYVLPLGGRDIDKVLPALDRAKGELRRAVAKMVALKYAPDLRFVIDDSFDRIAETSRMMADARVRRDVEVEPEGDD